MRLLLAFVTACGSTPAPRPVVPFGVAVARWMAPMVTSAQPCAWAMRVPCMLAGGHAP